MVFGRCVWNASAYNYGLLYADGTRLQSMMKTLEVVNKIAVKKKWYHEGLRFECTQCGNCCSGDPGYVWATKEEIKKIAQFLDEDEHWLGKKHLRRVGFRYSLTEKKDGDCIFLKREDGKSMCAIYPVRPLQCRTWPFWSPNLASGKAWDRIGENCPGLDHGKKYTYVQIEQRRTQKS